MPKKNISQKKTSKTGTNKQLLQKICYYKDIVEKTILCVQKYKSLDLITASDLNSCINNIQEIYKNIKTVESIIMSKSSSVNDIVNKIQKINDDISIIFKQFGTENVTDLLNIVFGINYYKDSISVLPKSDIIQYLHPIKYKIMNWNNNSQLKKTDKRLARNKIVEDFMIVDTGKSFECFDLARTTNIFQLKVYGIKICFQNPKQRKTLIVQCVVDDIIPNCCDIKYIQQLYADLHNFNNQSNDISKNEYTNFINSLSLKEILIYNPQELFHKFIGLSNQNKLVKNRTISETIKEFLSGDLYKQRTILIQLLLKNTDPEFQYMSYLLYDLLSNENNGVVDTQEQTLLFDSFPWSIKKFFKDAMKNTVDYTKQISTFETSKIPLEQQICLLKAPNSVKEKAMTKLKEIKAKTEDSGSKARAYLDGLLKIPFGIYKKERILNSTNDINLSFKKLVHKIKDNDPDFDIQILDKYTNSFIIQKIKFIKNTYLTQIQKKTYHQLIEVFTNNKRPALIDNICYINKILKENNIKKYHLCHSGKKNAFMKQQIIKTINDFSNNQIIIKEMYKKYKNINSSILTDINKHIEEIYSNLDYICKEISNISTTLDSSVHGHKNAKRQVERIIGQWITGEQTGYCFGFEGPPGVGKTSLARKGLAQCLKDEKGEPRPFSFIAIGGASNGSTIAGHNYTYVGSTWGKIVDVLIDNKCMNPIIFIDELDKISRTENGKEIIGILTHLIDTTQNEQFQDKYFSGIDLDLSKALFIFSYNDVSAIDRILLDRIHRIKFKHLTLEDKLTICNDYILPEFYKKFNISNLNFTDEILTFIIKSYTNESGVRKLKEILFEILSEINLQIIQNPNNIIDFIITKENVQRIYLKNKSIIKHKNIHSQPLEGVINGLWANSLGMGGIIPIESTFMPSNTFLELKLTGLQGDVMKESMNVAKTLAWKLTPNNIKTKLINKFKKTKMQCIHIHCPEGAVPKDGPSAGTAITTCIYSLFNDKKIKNDIAITGEINLQGQVTPIGGLELKILGGIDAGVKTFLYPKTNQDDFDKIMSETIDHSIFKDITFIPVENIQQVLDLVFI